MIWEKTKKAKNRITLPVDTTVYPATKNIFGSRIEYFNVGDSVTVFCLREETLEELRVTGVVINKKHKNNEISFKIFIQNEILVTFSSNSPFIVAVIKVKSGPTIRFHFK